MVISKSVPSLRSPTVPKPIPMVQTWSAGHLEHPLGRRVSGQVEVARPPAQEHIAHWPAYQGQLMAMADKQLTQLGRERRYSG